MGEGKCRRLGQSGMLVSLLTIAASLPWQRDVVNCSQGHTFVIRLDGQSPEKAGLEPNGRRGVGVVLEPKTCSLCGSEVGVGVTFFWLLLLLLLLLLMLLLLFSVWHTDSRPISEHLYYAEIGG